MMAEDELPDAGDADNGTFGLNGGNMPASELKQPPGEMAAVAVMDVSSPVRRFCGSNRPGW